jgi:GMP synthase (glutamine-hydrolysing)
MILVINMCQKIGLLEDEFVRPIRDIIGDCRIVHYLDDYAWEAATHVILSGTALADDAYLDHLERFTWLKDADVPILGICAGMQVIAALFDASLTEAQEIGFVQLHTNDDTLGISHHTEAYALHHLACACPEGFRICARSEKAAQMIRHETRPIYGTLFHPEVLNKDMVRRFVSLD